ncbi:putative ph domain-containing protein [Golovinomyces cichoracearum]|uniref:Putative ph domain-containing protein n=1 Tax=Golovinomyces cichoracearum TaxID=62708 RepID=A0A420J6B3_9PEZI|nr:putative ph domain-containing protein [Golovinomyces cichoracearum]
MSNIESTYPFEKLPMYFRKIHIQPREDEGREALPAYSTTINFTHTLTRKMEFDNPNQRATNRKWHRVFFSLQGTALNLYKYPRSLFGNKTSSPNISLPLIRSYNLQHAQVGLAADYAKKKHVIRLRVETEQFLLSCCKIRLLVDLMQSLCAAIDLATPLDDRDYPQDFCMPRRQRRVRSSLQTREEGRGRDITNLVSTPRLHSRSQNTRSSSISRSNSRCCINDRSHSDLRLLFSSDEDDSPLNFSIYSPQQSPSTIPSCTCSSTEKNPNNNSEIKWQPFHRWSPLYDLMYAKRCFEILTLCAPRKSNKVIVNGEFYVVDRVTGCMSKLRDATPHLRKRIEVTPHGSNIDLENSFELPPEYRELIDIKT